MGVKFDHARCVAAFRLRMLDTVKQMQQLYLVEAQSHMKTADGADSLEPTDIAVVADYFTAKVVGGAWAAMDHWGTGSEMDTSNPEFPGYTSSPQWNKDRQDLAIRARAVPYDNIFGETVTKGSKVGGRNLEHKYPPQKPSYALSVAAAWLLNGQVQNLLANAIKTFPWSSFIIVTKN